MAKTKSKKRTTRKPSVAVACEPTGSPIGNILRARREALKLTQQNVAQRSGVSVRNLAALEIGEVYDPRSSTLVALAKTLRLSTDYILGLAAA